VGFGCRAILLSASERWGGRFSENQNYGNKARALSQIRMALFILFYFDNFKNENKVLAVYQN
jgi:hypothetical protein